MLVHLESRKSSCYLYRSKKNADLYKFNLDPDSDDELQQPKEEQRLSSVNVMFPKH